MPGVDPELDRQLSPSSCVASLDAYLREYASRSAAARRALDLRRNLRYGPHADERLDYFPAADRDAPLHVFVHGGNWQAVTKEDSAFPAPDFVGAGVGFVALDYGVAPAVGLDAMVAMVRRGVRWLLAHADALGFDRSRLQLSGASAGAHLAAMAVVPDDHDDGPALASALAGLVLTSGLYDLEPVRRSYINEALDLDAAAARRNSPFRRLPAKLPPVVLARGGLETDEYVRQHDLMKAALSGRAPLVEVVEPHRNHFDLTYDLGARGTQLGDAVLAQIEATSFSKEPAP